MFAAIGLGMFAAVAGLVGYRRRQDPGPARLAGAGGLALGLVVCGLGTTRYVLTLVAIRTVERWL
jgi:LPXTG-motif cell wall-anchored protein